MTQMGVLEILVKATGMDKVLDKLEKGAGKVVQHQKKINDYTKNLQTFIKQFGGAMEVILAGVGGAISMLLVQVPVFQQLFGTLEVLIAMLAYMLDEVLRPIIQPLIDGIMKFADTISTWPPWLKEIIGWTILTAAVLTILAGVTIALIALFASGIGEAAAVVLLVFIALFAAVIIIVAAIVLLREAWKNNWLGIRDITKAVVDFIVDYYTFWWNTAKAVFNGIIAAATYLINWFWDTFGTQIMGVVENAIETFNAWKHAIDVVFGGVMYLVGLFFAGLKYLWDNNFLGIKTTVTFIFEQIKTAISNALSIATDIIRIALSGIEAYFNYIKLFFGTVWDAIVLIFKTAVNLLLGNINIFLDLLRLDFPAVIADAMTNLQTLIDFFVNGATIIANAWKGIATIIVNAFNGAINAINGISYTVPDWVPVIGGKSWSPGIPNISMPSLDSQGIIQKTGVAQVHAGEGVYAMDKLKEVMSEVMSRTGGGFHGNIIIQIDGREIGRVINAQASKDFGGRGVYG